MPLSASTFGSRHFGYAGQPYQVGVPDPDARYARPLSDISAGAWAPSSGSSLAAMVADLADPDTFIRAGAASTCEMTLGAVADPQSRFGQVLRYAAHDPDGGALTVELRQGDALIASWLHAPLPLTPTLHQQMLTPEQCDSITDYSALRIRLIAA